MSTQTSNYKLTKPATTDKYNVTIFNANADIIDTQMKANADAAGSKQPKITGAATTITDANLTVSRALVSDGSGKVAVSPVTSTELGYLSGVSDDIQDQFNNITNNYAKKSDIPASVTVESALSSTSTNPVQNKVIYEALDDKQPTITGAATSITDSNLTASRALISDASGKVAVSDVTATEIGYLDGVESNVQTQITTAQTTADTAKTNAATAQSTADGKQDPIVAGTGIALADDGVTINHSNSVTAQTSYLGSATAIPRLKFDAQGHITGVATATVYPPTSAGESGQVWVSDGSGTGAWKTLITASTSEPTSTDGSDGDFWAVYE